MDRKALARKIRDAIFDQADQDGRVMHGDSLDTVIEQVLAANMILPTPEEADFTAYPWGMVIDKQDVAGAFVYNSTRLEVSDFAFWSKGHAATSTENT